MREEVREGFLTWSRQFEGYTDWFYLDRKGYVTVGIGLLADPLFLASGLDWRRRDGSKATPTEISSSWLRVKNEQGSRLLGGGHVFWQDLTSIRATPESIHSLCIAKLQHFEEVLTEFFPRFQDWPWQAQQGVLSMAWAMGPGFPPSWPMFTVAARGEQWDLVASACHISEVENEGIAPRNKANEALFRVAATTHYVEDAEVDWVKPLREKE